MFIQAGDTHMAILLWELIIAAAFVLVAVGALAYLITNLLLAVIHKAVETKSAGLISAPAWRRSERQSGAQLRARFTKLSLSKSISSPSLFNRAARKDLRRKPSGQALVEFTLMFVLFLAIIWIPADFGLA